MRIGLYVDAVFTTRNDGESYVASGGVGVYAKELLSALLQAEDENEYLVMRGRPTSVPLLSHPRVKEISPSRHRRGLIKTGFWREWVLRNESLDVLHELEPSSGAIRLHDYPLVVTVHDVIPLLYPESFRLSHTLTFKAFCRHNLARADAVIAVSHNTCRDMQKVFPVTLNKTTVIHEAGQSLDFTRQLDLNIMKGFNLSKPFILSVATIEPRKNHKALLDAYWLLRESGYELQLVLIGPPGWKNTEFYRHDALKKYEPDIIFPGTVPPHQLANFYQQAAVFVYPSFYEGFGMPVLEAAAASIPAIVGKNSSLVEIMGDAAYYVSERPGGREIAEAVTAIIDNQDLATRLGLRGKEQAASFSWAKTAQQTLAVYRQAAKGRAR